MTMTTSLATLATTHPAASRVFHRFGLDFCCGGRQPLADACRAKGLDPEAVLAAITVEETSTDLPRWDKAPIPDLNRFLSERYDFSLRLEFPALSALAT